ncbi:cytochrome P450 [Actinomycetospora sp. OC33-EN08]|uniref:Cytochrome P450 n=1 Tax=Actinomycetospora aurantiaca TaxID=3129233 RepID=A0ABU8MP61_9PSEU
MTTTSASPTWSTFDPFAPEQRADPYPALAALRDEAPCAHLDRYGVWLVSRYDDVAAVLKDWETFSSAQGAGLEPVATPEEGGVILSTDPPEHTRVRRAVARDFTPKAIGQLEPRVRELVGRALEVALAEGEIDWVSHVAQPVPTTVMAELMGYPDRHRNEYCRWASTIFDSMGCPAGGESSVLGEAIGGLFGLVGQIAADGEYVAGGWADRIVRAGERDELAQGEVVSLLGGILVAAMDTTVNMLGNLLHALATHPDQWRRLRERPDLASGAVEESLRFESPVQPGFFRVTTTETTVAGVAVPPGARVMVAFGSANRDPRQFPDPDRFLIDRTPNEHLAFGRGVHFCLGAPVARMIGRVVLEKLVSSVAEIRPAGVARRKDNRMLRGFEHLPLALAPS